MSGLAAGLIGLAALFADRSMSVARHRSALHRVRPYPRSSARVWQPPPWAVIAAGSLAGWLVAGVPTAVVGALAVIVVRVVRRRRRQLREASLLQEQLADAVRTIVASLRAGLSIPQAIGYAAREAQPPLSTGLTELVGGLDAGVPFDEAIGGWADQVGGDDARLVAAVVSLHRRTGGDLPMVLDRVADTLRERLAARREVLALTAQGRLSGVILGVLPVGFFAVLWLTSRRDIEAALHSTAGLLSVSLGLVLEAGAFVWIRRLLEVR